MMGILKWVLAGAAAIPCAYFGNQLSGWPGAAVAGLGAGLAVVLLFGEQWVLTVVTVLASTYLVFFGLTDYGATAKEKAAAVRNTVAQERQRGEAAGAGLGAKGGKLPGPAPAASAAAPAGYDGGSKVIKDCPDCPSLVVVAAGSFDMGSRAGDGVDSRELPQHRVSVGSFAAGRFAVTKGEFAAFVKATGYKTEAEREGGCFAWGKGGWAPNPKFQWRKAGIEQGADHPVVCVSWNDAQEYVRWLGQVTGRAYRLLSEAEREYAARAGSTSAFWWGDTLSPERAHYDATARGYESGARADAPAGTVPVNRFPPNPFGLYGVNGNVWEWVADCRHENYAGAPSDGRAWTANCVDERRMLRGGGWIGDPANLRSASRAWFTPDFRFHAGGLRVARDL